MSTLEYTVTGMSCDHCRVAVTAEVLAIAGVASVDVDLGTKRVAVHGENLDDAAIRAAIHEAGYETA
jgi:copper chaperone